MSETTYSPHKVPVGWWSYSNFVGMDRSRDITALEVSPDGERPQPFWDLKGAVVSSEGILIREAKYRERNVTVGGIVTALKFFAENRFLWAEQDGAGINLVADNSSSVATAYPLGSFPHLESAGPDVISFVSGHTMLRFTGADWTPSTSSLMPGFGVYVQQRLFVGGIPGQPTIVMASRAGNVNVFPPEEPEDNASNTKASFIDVVDSIGKNDRVVGLGSFEGDRLAIFTTDQVVIYLVHPSFEEWTIDNRANIKNGVVGPAAIANIEQDLAYISRFGIHIIKRSDQNGLSISTLRLTNNLRTLFRTLMKQTFDLSKISMMHDPDNNTLNCFFPQDEFMNSVVRLTAYINEDYEIVNWSRDIETSFTCADSASGDMVWGSNGKIFSPTDRLIDIDGYFAPSSDEERTKMVAVTPILWHGNMFETKDAKNLLVHATGSGELTIKATNEEGVQLGSWTEPISDADDNLPTSVPLSVERRLDFEASYRSLILTFESEDNEDIRLIGFAIELKEDD